MSGSLDLWLVYESDKIAVDARFYGVIVHTHFAGSIPAQAVYRASLPIGMPIPFTPWSPSPVMLHQEYDGY
jgi:hypothetical protein